ncbi:MAG: flagellar brake protein [Thermacetogeniaceae bacterium]|nr:flagellar brake protein [Thermoanaerobacterales bacterium]NLN20673.1 flagellar brake protein [Syntrophomonadaceae bacterium]
MFKEAPKVKQMVNVVIGKEHPFAGSYPCMVKEITTKALVITAPMDKWEAVPIKIGEKITVNYWSGTKFYTFKSEVTAVNKGYQQTITVLWPRRIEHLQRRNFLRVQAEIPITFALAEGDDIYHASTLDISGGGVLIKSPVKLQINDQLDMQLTIPDRGVIDTGGKVVRCEESKGCGGQFFLVGVDFTAINERDRERIIAFVFERERYLNKRRLL